MSERTDTSPEHRRLPRFASYEDEARFWDTHNALDLTPVDPAELKLLDQERLTYRGSGG